MLYKYYMIDDHIKHFSYTHYHDSSIARLSYLAIKFQFPKICSMKAIANDGANQIITFLP